MTPRQKIDQLAESIADAAVRDDIELQEKVEALKVLAVYLGIVQKGRRKDDDSSTDGIDFEAFRLAARDEVVDQGEHDGSEGRSTIARAHTGRRQRVRDIRAGRSEIADPN